ncbi:MAG: transcriptional regulator [Desulfobulbaceae bacterium]|nr:transcriptional regulator [Desulfobulbaceae bacterium]
MKKFKPQHSRLLFIDKKIRENCYPSCATLAEEWEVSSKTIQRDLDYMRNMLDAPLSYSAKKRGYYYTEENFHLPAMALNDSDLFAIFIAGKVLKQYENTPIYSRLTSVFDKISDSLPEKVTMDPTHLEGRFSFFQNPLTTISTTIWENIFNALRSSKTISILYRKPGISSPEKRCIDPYHVISFQGEWYVVAFCRTKQDIRTFALSRISEALLTDNFFKIAEDFDFQQTTRSRFGVQWSEKEYEVKIRFSAQAAPYVKERIWQPGQKISENVDKSIIMTCTVSHLFELKRWILSWGNMARVLEPVELADEIKKTLQDSLNNYEV